MELLTTASQTVGPYVAIGFKNFSPGNPASLEVSGARITLCGRVLDGDGKPVSDAVIETWQANSHGRYAHPEDDQNKPLVTGFRGWGRVLPDVNGAYRLATVKPGCVPGPGGSVQAPHLVALVFMRGMLKHLVTRIYFPDEPANTDDPVLKLVAPERRATLIAKHIAAEPGVLEWNVILQGRDETVFFDY